MITEINSIQDVKIFAEQVISEGTNLHPDDDFRNYININTELPTYTEPEVQLRNFLMSQCFQVCEKYNVDIYGLMQQVFIEKTGLNNIFINGQQIS